MRVLLTDLDRTLTDETLILHPGVPTAIASLRRAGVAAILVTGRSYDHLLANGHDATFDALVAENGAIVSVGTGGAPDVLHERFAGTAREALDAFASEIAWGRVIGSAARALTKDIGAALHAAGIAHALVPNADEIMILPPGVDKATGARRALHLLGATGATTWAIGDGENDVVLLEMADVAAVAQNAHPAARAVADIELPERYGEAFLLLVEKMLAAPNAKR